MNRTYDPGNHFFHLKQVHICTCATLSLRELFPLFQLPSLESLRIDRLVEPAEAPDLPWSEVSRPFSIQHLDLVRSYMHTNTLVKLISACRTLKTIYLDHLDEEWQPDLPEIYINYERLSEALLQHRDTLESVRIEEFIDTSDSDDPRSLSDRALVRSLADMPCLKDLILCEPALIDASQTGSFNEEAVLKLPRSLTKLELIDPLNWEFLFVFLKKLSSRVPERLNLLKEVRLDSLHIGPEVEEELVPEMARLFEDVGVEFWIEDF